MGVGGVELANDCCVRGADWELVLKVVVGREVLVMPLRVVLSCGKLVARNWLTEAWSAGVRVRPLTPLLAVSICIGVLNPSHSHCSPPFIPLLVLKYNRLLDRLWRQAFRMAGCGLVRGVLCEEMKCLSAERLNSVIPENRFPAQNQVKLLHRCR